MKSICFCKLLFFSAILGGLLNGCIFKERKQITLHYGYKIVRMYGDAHSLVSVESREIVMPNVVRATDNERYIVGLRTAASPKQSSFDSQRYGYFIYDKQRKILYDGYSKTEFEERLRKENIGLSLE